MSSTNKGNVKFIVHKIDFLKECGSQLCLSVNEFVSKTVRAAKLWVEENSENQITYDEMSTLIENAVKYLTVKSEEISEEAQKIPLTTVADPQGGTEETCMIKHCTRSGETGQLSDDDVSRRQMLPRIGVLEEAMCSLRISVDKATEQQTDIKANLHSLIEQMDAANKKLNGMKTVPKKLKKLTKKQEQYEESVLDATNDLKELENETRNKTATLSSLLETLDTKIESRIQFFDERLTVAETEEKENLERVDRSYMEMEVHYKILCQMMSDKIVSLEKLRNIMNTTVQHKTENVKKLENLVKENGNLVSRVTQLECHDSSNVISFSALGLLTGSRISKGKIVIGYSSCDINIGNHFDMDSGIFTAPEDGQYVACLSLSIYSGISVSVNVVKDRPGRGRIDRDNVCHVRAEVKNTQACNFGLAGMKTGDRLFVELLSSSSEGSCTFSCFRIK